MARLKYPIGIQSFAQIREEGYVYIDKTDLVYDLVNTGAVYFLSRPRRFGKSLLLSTLECYFHGERDLFRGLKIDRLEKDWKKYPVFKIDFNGQDFTRPESLLQVLEAFVANAERIYGASPDPVGLGMRFAYVLHAAHEQTGLRCVVLVDEYDKPMLDVLDTGYTCTVDGRQISLEDYHHNTLKSFYSVFKLASNDLKFVMLTGVTKFSQISVFSGFNQPKDISMTPAWDALCGITQEELDTQLAQPVRDMAEAMNMSFDEMRSTLSRQYDGYHFSSRMTDIYNPFSLLNALDSQHLDDYWFKTGTPTYLIRLLAHFDENMNDIAGKYYDSAQFIDYKADKERPLPMIYQSGYLTIKDYDRDSNSYLLDFPNNEVKKGFLTLLSANYLKSKEEPMCWLLAAQRALKQGKLSDFRDLLTTFLAGIPYSARRKENEREQERYFQYTVYLLMHMLSCYTLYHEKESSQGRADCVIETPNYVYIFEYKLNHPASEAIAQIEKKGCSLEYTLDKRTVYLVGVSFSSDTGTVSDWMVKRLVR